MEKVTLATIAAKLDVSTVAVYKALNNQKGVSDELRKKIKAYAKSVGYAVKSENSEISNKRFLFFIKQVFFLTPSEQYYSSIFYFLSSELAKVNSILQVVFLEPNQTIEQLENTISAFDPDGMFFICETNSFLLKFAEASPIPAIIIDLYSPLYHCNYVFVDNYQVSYMLTKYMMGKGHRKIGFVGNITKTSSIADRYFGYLKALSEENIVPGKDWHINENIERRNELATVPEHDMPTAFICHCDSAAQRLITTLMMKNYRIPEDISVASFDNTPLSETLIPKLTSVGPDKDYYARKIFNAMIEVFKNRHVNMQIRAQLVERDSVKTVSA